MDEFSSLSHSETPAISAAPELPNRLSEQRRHTVVPIFGGFQPFGTTVCRRRSLNRFGSLGTAELAGVSE